LSILSSRKIKKITGVRNQPNQPDDPKSIYEGVYKQRRTDSGNNSPAKDLKRSRTHTTNYNNLGPMMSQQNMNTIPEQMSEMN
jgi:hypothetical protein